MASLAVATGLDNPYAKVFGTVEAWEKMIERVERWYDTHFTPLVANGSEKREGERKHAKT